MNQYSMVAAQTFVLKTNIHCGGCEKKLKKLLQDVEGVHKISIDAVQGKIEILGTTDPQIVLKLLQKKYWKKSELVWEPEPMIYQKDLQIIRRPMSHANNYHGILDKDIVVQLQKLSEIDGLKSVEVNRDGVKITFKEDGFNGENETCSARKSPRKAMHDDCNFRGNHDQLASCSRNEGMYKQYCDGCCYPTNCICMASPSHGSISTGIPWPGSYFPSTPPELAHIYYNPPPPPAPPPHETPYNHSYYSTSSEDNPRSCVIL